MSKNAVKGDLVSFRKEFRELLRRKREKVEQLARQAEELIARERIKRLNPYLLPDAPAVVSAEKTAARVTQNALVAMKNIMLAPDRTTELPPDFDTDDEIALTQLLSVFGYRVEFYSIGNQRFAHAVKPLEEIPFKEEQLRVAKIVTNMPLHIRLNPVYTEMYTATHALNRNFVQFNVGPTGAGKSWGGLRFCYDLDENFDVRQQVFFKPKELLSRIQSEDLRKGEAHLWDEVGVQINARRFYTLKNLITSYIIQTFRYKNTILIETVPSFDLIDAQVRKLGHGLMEFLPRTMHRPQARANYYFISYSPRLGKIYFIRPRIVDKKATFVIRLWYIPKVPDEIAEAYEKKRAKEMSDLYTQLLELAESLEDTNAPQARVARVINSAIEMITNGDPSLVAPSGKILFYKLRTKYGLNHSDYSFVKTAIISELTESGIIEKRGNDYYIV